VRRKPKPSSAPTSAGQRCLFSDTPDRQEPAGAAGTGNEIPPVSPGVPPAARLEQVVLAVETWEIDTTASPDDVALAETTLARLLVKHWRAQQPGPHAGAKTGAEFGAN